MRPTVGQGSLARIYNYPLVNKHSYLKIAIYSGFTH